MVNHLINTLIKLYAPGNPCPLVPRSPGQAGRSTSLRAITRMTRYLMKYVPLFYGFAVMNIATSGKVLVVQWDSRARISARHAQTQG